MIKKHHKQFWNGKNIECASGMCVLCVVVWCCVMLYDAVWCWVTLCDVVWCYVMLCVAVCWCVCVCVCVAVCCCMLLCVAVCVFLCVLLCVLLCVDVCWCVLLCVDVCCCLLLSVAVCCCVVVCCCILLCVAVYCCVLLCVLLWCCCCVAWCKCTQMHTYFSWVYNHDWVSKWTYFYTHSQRLMKNLLASYSVTVSSDEPQSLDVHEFPLPQSIATQPSVGIPPVAPLSASNQNHRVKKYFEFDKIMPRKIKIHTHLFWSNQNCIFLKLYKMIQFSTFDLMLSLLENFFLVVFQREHPENWEFPKYECM